MVRSALCLLAAVSLLHCCAGSQPALALRGSLGTCTNDQDCDCPSSVCQDGNCVTACQAHTADLAPAELTAFQEIYDTTGGDTWTNKCDRSDPCAYYGHACCGKMSSSDAHASITSLHLDHNNLKGNIPEEIKKLTNLNLLHFHSNENDFAPLGSSGRPTGCIPVFS